MKDFLKTTVIGGILFLLPVALVLLVLGHALRLTLQAMRPISHGLALDEMGAVAGIGASSVLSALALIVISFAAGMVARTTSGERITRWFERSLVGGMPHYRMVKTMAEGFTQLEESGSLKPVLVSLQSGWQIGYLLEQIADGWVAVFLPTAPTPMSGTIMYIQADRVRPIDITMVQATALVKQIGIGSGEALRGVDLTLPVTGR